MSQPAYAPIVVTVSLPLRTVSEANRASHEHWRARHARAAEQRGLTAMALRGHLLRAGLVQRTASGVVLACPVVVLTTRLSAGSLDAHDNLPMSLKSVIDGIGDAMGLASDRDERVAWTYAQRRVKKGAFGVEISVREGGAVGRP